MVSNFHRLIFTYLSPLSVATCFERSSVDFQEPSGASPRSYEGDESSQGSGGTKEGHEEGDEGQEVGDDMRSLPGPGRARPACAARVASLFPSEEVETAGALGAASPGAPSAH